MSQMNSIYSPRKCRRNLLHCRNLDVKDKGKIIPLSGTIFVELTPELSFKVLTMMYLDIQVIFRAILLNFSIKKS